MIESLDMRGESIRELVTTYEKLKRMQDHRNILVGAMAEVKTTVDNWEEGTRSLDDGSIIKHDVDRLKEIIDWCLKNIKDLK